MYEPVCERRGAKRAEPVRVHQLRHDELVEGQGGQGWNDRPEGESSVVAQARSEYKYRLRQESNG